MKYDLPWQQWWTVVDVNLLCPNTCVYIMPEIFGSSHNFGKYYGYNYNKYCI